MSYDLSKLLSWLDIKSDDLSINVTGLCSDSRKVKPGEVFIALCGNDNHGIDFAYQVQRAGASAIFAESQQAGKAKPKSRQQPLTIPVVEIDELSKKLGHLAANFYNNPSEQLKITGITGTNGKTSSCWLLLQAWSRLGVESAYIGTLGYGTIKQLQQQANTTPCALSLQKMLAEFVEQKISHLSLEVSSHGLELGRVNSIKFDGVAFTNISRDHLDFHHTMQDYADAKKKLFFECPHEFSVLNAEDFYAKQWLNELKNNTTYGMQNSKVDLYATGIVLSTKGIDFKLHWQGKSYHARTELMGRFNIDNIMLVVAALLNQNFSIDQIIDLIPEFQPVPGRMNRINREPQDPLVIVDYAHTPDALEQVLKALKEHNSVKIWCVFGCGGNRDKGKRPQMGHIAQTLADYVIVTDDNPRYENNKQIAQDILMGMNQKPRVIHSRKDAIAYAIAHAHSQDIILIAGKGHEPYQLINGTYHSFDDKIIAQEILSLNREKTA